MRKERRSLALIILSVGAVAVLLMCIGFLAVQAGAQQTDKQQPQPPQVYNPYPPGILPAGLDSEIARVLREIDVIEGRAIERWHSFPLPTRWETPPGQIPPVLSKPAQ